ncbi:glycine cleavage system protein GcvH [Aromatoleum petrolei]|uniref:Glycine cleavage system H protein n=1 Tax=Aromatoleum petrolei TaxID=76116 RepID=A0ABX1MM82_9RHOO|nr:glycine cleavage system protein GcvH [Aromatoleum petrolei]NMF89062.1 glycine cleavage system protein GcvH [Aromatoleum petrolei]QTQ38347.1 Glycine cleavage system H protein [Aromatoleum petrolei]
MSTIKFTEDHEWLSVEGDVATVGITDYAQNALGDIVFVQLPDVGASFAAGDEAAVIESVKAAGELKMPLAGTIVEVNAALADAPATVNEDPMGAGWFVRVRLDDPSAFAGLLDQAAYDKLTA